MKTRIAGASKWPPHPHCSKPNSLLSVASELYKDFMRSWIGRCASARFDYSAEYCAEEAQRTIPRTALSAHHHPEVMKTLLGDAPASQMMEVVMGRADQALLKAGSWIF